MFRRCHDAACVLSLFVLFLVGCRGDVSEIFERENGLYLRVRPFFLGHLKVLDWKVGPHKKKQTLSKGLAFRVNLPVLKSRDLKRLIDEYGANAWLVRIGRTSNGMTKILSHFYVPFIDRIDLPRKKLVKLNQKKYFVVSLYYTDAARSSRFENFPCPALGHNLVIQSSSLEKNVPSGELILIDSKSGRPLQSKTSIYEVTGNKIDGGRSLRGEFFAEIALFDHKRERFFGNFYRAENLVKVRTESPRFVGSCANFKIPEKKERTLFLPKKL